MKNIKFLVCLLLMMAVVMTGCGSKDKADSTGDSAKVEMDIESALLGTYTNNVYTNDFFGTTFTLPADWSAYSESELIDYNGFEAGSVLVDEILSNEMGTLFYAADSDDYAYVSVDFEEIGVLYDDVQGFADFEKEMVESIYGEEEGSEIGELTTTTINGKEAIQFKYVADFSGIKNYTNATMLQVDNYVIKIETNYFDDDQADIDAVAAIESSITLK